MYLPQYLVHTFNTDKKTEFVSFYRVRTTVKSISKTSETFGIPELTVRQWFKGQTEISCKALKKCEPKKILSRKEEIRVKREVTELNDNRKRVTAANCRPTKEIVL